MDIRAVGSTTIGFAVAEEDRDRLERLVEHFGDGDRSAFLRESLRIMEGVMLAEEFRDLQGYGQQKLAAKGYTLADIARLVKEAVLEGRSATEQHEDLK